MELLYLGQELLIRPMSRSLQGTLLGTLCCPPGVRHCLLLGDFFAFFFFLKKNCFVVRREKEVNKLYSPIHNRRPVNSYRLPSIHSCFFLFRGWTELVNKQAKPAAAPSAWFSPCRGSACTQEPFQGDAWVLRCRWCAAPESQLSPGKTTLLV